MGTPSYEDKQVYMGLDVHREFFKGQGSTLNIAGDKLLALLIKEGVA